MEDLIIPEGKALIYIVRPSNLGTLIKIKVYCGNNFIGYTKGENYLYAFIEPGNQSIISKSENKSVLNLNIEAGKIYYIKQNVSLGFIKARNKLILLDETGGQIEKGKCNPSKFLGLESPELKEVKRGGCLTAILILMFIFNPLMSIYYLFAGDSIREALPNVPDWAIFIFALLGFINLGSAIAVWNWKRFGLFCFWISTIATLIINLSFGFTFLQSISGLLGPIIITLLVMPKWSEFK